MIPSQGEIDRLRDAIRDRVRAHVGPDCLVVYDAFPFDDAGRPIDNLDDIAVPGRCRFQQKHDPAWGSGRDYRSEVVDDPTWLQVVVLAEAMIRTTGDRAHCFLERVGVVGIRNGVQIVEFEMGS